MIQIPPVGSTLHVTFPKHFERKYSMKVKIVDVDVKNDPFGTIKYQVISKTTTRQVIKQECVTSYKTTNFNHSTQEYNKVPYTYMKDVKDENGYVMQEVKDVEGFTNTFSIVEPNWFNEELTGRKIEILK